MAQAVPGSAALPRRGRLKRVLLHVGLLEWLILAELLALGMRLLQAPDRAAAEPYLWGVGGCLLLWGVSTWIFRSRFDGRRWPRLAFNVAQLVACLAPFVWLKAIIPIIHPGEVDALLRGWDMSLFGFDAAVWLERFATPFTSEWFSVVYFGYYVVGGLVVLYLIFFHRRIEELCEFALIILGVNFVAFVLYTIFPALGPYHLLASEFKGPLPGPVITPGSRSLCTTTGRCAMSFPRCTPPCRWASSCSRPVTTSGLPWRWGCGRRTSSSPPCSCATTTSSTWWPGRRW